MLIAILAVFFLAIFALAGWLASAFSGKLRRRFVEIPAEVAAVRGQPIGTANLLKEERVSSIGVYETMLQRFPLAGNLRRLLEEADLDWSVGRLTSLMLMSGICTNVVLSRITFIPLIFALLTGALAAAAPYLWVRRLKRLRLERFELFFPEALDSMARARRAGHPLATGLEVMASESDPPVSTEFRKTLDEWKLGRGWEQALENLAVRVPLTNVAVFVAAVRLHNRTGGRLTDVLAKLSESMREAGSVEGEIKALSAHGRVTGLVLTLLPVGIAGLMMYVNPSYLSVLGTHPVGKNLLFASLGCLVAAHFVIGRILKIKY